MALQGTLDTFALPDVLRLLAATAKTGRLQIEGDRGTGEVWLDDGKVVGGVTPALTFDTADIVFELLRHSQGSFEFLADETVPEGHEPLDVDDVIGQAEAKLADWRGVEKVVPSMQCWVALVEQLPAPEVTLSQERWTTLLAIGEGRTVLDLDSRLELGEIRVSNAVKSLADEQIVVVTPVSDGTEAEPSESHAEAVSDDLGPLDDFGFDLDGIVLDHESDGGPPASLESMPESGQSPDLDEAVRAEIETSDDNPGLGGSRDVGLDSSLSDETANHSYLTGGAGADDVDSHGATMPEPLPRGEHDAANGMAHDPFVHPAHPVEANGMTDQAADDDVNRQLSQLSPKAARAIAAAAEGDAPVTGDEPGDRPEEPMNRNVLMKFISSQ